MSLIAKQTIGSGGAASVSFSNIPQTFTDLKILISARTLRTGTDVGDEIFVQFNGDTGNNYTTRMIEGDGSGTRSAGYSSQPKLIYSVAPTDNATANTFGNAEYYIPNYTSTSSTKSVSYDAVMENNATLSYSYLNAGLWSATPAAITSITLTAIGTWVEFSEFALYGISSSSTQNTSVPLASGGDVIATDGSYWYHAFKSSGSFTPLKNLDCSVLSIAGGGGGGAYAGGGGGAGAGAGGLVYNSTVSVIGNTVYTATVGSGGAKSTTTANGTNGGNSNLTGGSLSLTAAVGGGGGGSSITGSTAGNGSSGGSGGGGGGAQVTSGGSATSGQGSAGGAGASAGNAGAGGGGGFSATGSAGTDSVGGNGGAGTSTYSSWGSVTVTGQNVSGTYYYAGGGGGGIYSGSGAPNGTGGNGGGGTAVSNSGSTPGNGLASTGGGGAGSGYGSSPGPAGNGGSGIIIIRYAVA